MNDYKSIWNVNIRRTAGYLLLVAILIFLLSVSFVASVPSAPIIAYSSNTTYTSGIVNRSVDVKGTITTVILTSTQQDYKWKAYVGNVSGTLALSDATGKAIYDWSSGTATGEVYVSRFSNINWNNIACVTQGAIDNEETGISMSTTIRDNINATFNATNHGSFLVGTTPISGCRSTATYINGAAQTMGPSAYFQEILLRDTATSNLVYAGIINASTLGYNNQRYDFQVIVGENESATNPSPYFFWVELG
jgi:hypothetical protein